MDPIVNKGGGPIEGIFEIDLSDGPGVYELGGGKGVGKSTMLNAVSLLTGSKVTITLNDNADEGYISGFGVAIPLGSRKRRKGELEVEHLDPSRFDLVDLIDPDGKTPATRDATRIKALAMLTGVSLGEADLTEVLGDGAKPDIKHTDDPVLFVSRAKAACDQIAKRLATEADSLRKTASLFREDVTRDSATVDMGAETDEEILARAVQDRSTYVAKTEAAKEAAQADETRRQKARAQLAKALDEYKGLPLSQLEEEKTVIASDVVDAKNALEAADEAVRKAKEVQAAALKDASDQIAKLEQIDKDIVACKDHGLLIDKLRAIVEEPSDYGDTDTEAAKLRQLDAVKAQADGLMIRQIKAKESDITRLTKESHEKDKESAIWTDKGQRVACLLTEKLNLRHITISHEDGVPRLFYPHPQRGPTYLDQTNGLSDGERVCAIIDEVIPLLPSPAAVVIPQRVYQDLPPGDRVALSKSCTSRKIYAFGGVVTDGPLSVQRVTW